MPSIKNITIGQHFPGDSVIHRLDPRMKICLTIFYIVLLFSVSNYFGLVIPAAFLILCYAISGIPFKVVLRSLRPLLPILLFTMIINLFFIGSEQDVIFRWAFITITREGIFLAITMAIRIICLLSGTFLLTYTTSPIVLTDAIERLLSPLKKIRFPVHELAMMMTIALRFIPTLIEETDKIMSAQKARGADLDSGGFMQRAKALIPILIPLFVSAFRRADELALAMECRCYRGGEGRTRLKELHLAGRDYLALATMLVLLLGIISINIWVPTPQMLLFPV